MSVGLGREFPVVLARGAEHQEVGGGCRHSGHGVSPLIGLILIFLTVQRLIFAVVFPVSVDGSYALAVSRDRALSYFDHPTLAFLFARIAADVFGTEYVVLTRLPYVVMGMVTAWLVFDLTRVLFGSRAGLWALVAYATAPYFAQVTGVVMLPDTPLNMFLLAAARCILPIMTQQTRLPKTVGWVMAGVFFGCACLSKYHAFLILGSGAVGLLALREGRTILCTAGPWLFLVVAGIFFIPVLLWNASHDWVSFGFQLGRPVNDCFGEQNECVEMSSRLGEYYVDEVTELGFVSSFIGHIYYLFPFVFVMSIYLILSAFNSKDRPFIEKYLLFISIPTVLFFAILTFFSRIFPHWPMSGYMFMLPLIGLWCARQEGKLLRLLRAGAVWLISLGLVVNGSLAAYYRLSPIEGFYFIRPITGWHDVDWPVLKRRVAAESAKIVVLGQNWHEAGYLAYYLGPDVPVGVYSQDAHHFDWFDPPVFGSGDSGLAVRVVARGHGPETARAMLRELKESHEIKGPPEIFKNVGTSPVRSEMVIIPVTVRDSPLARR